MIKYLILVFLFTIQMALASDFMANNYLALTSFQAFDPGNSAKKITIKAPTLPASWTFTLPLDGGVNHYALFTDGTGVASWEQVNDPNAWSLTGNAGTTPGTNFLGTTDAKDLVFKTNGAQNASFDNSTGYMLLGASGTPARNIDIRGTGAADGIRFKSGGTAAGRYDFIALNNDFFSIERPSSSIYAIGISNTDGVGIGTLGSVGTSTFSADSVALDRTVSIFRGNSAQTATLTEWQDSLGNILAQIDKDGNITGANLSGTNTGNVTLTAVGAVPNANGASLSGQALTLQPANTSFPGVLTAADWNTFNSKGSGSVTTLSVATANGFAGTVANPTTTPAITLTTSITGILKGNGTAISAATSGTDYAPATSGSTLLLGDGAGGFANYSAQTCTNQAITALSTAGAKTCSTITSAYVDTSIALTGVDINTSNQVTATHLAAALPVNQGGAGQTSYTDGQLLIGNTSGNTLTKATLTAGSGISITNGNGSISIATSGGGGSLAPTVNAQTGTTYTLAAADSWTAGGPPLVTMNNAASQTVTVPLHASVAITNPNRLDIQQIGVGVTNIVPAAGVTLNTAGGNCISRQYGIANLFQIATDTWTMVGNLTSAVVTGGTHTTSGGHDIYTFTSGGTLGLTGCGAQVSYLALGSGGGGGGGNGGGGGGGGGHVVTGAEYITPGNYTIVVGGSVAGGTGTASGSDGVASTYNGHSAAGGSGGGFNTTAGNNGTNGGGGGGSSASGGTGTNHAGGNGLTSAGAFNGGGGAGDGAVGSNSTPTVAGAGGTGTSSSISGASVCYGGGGGGGANSPGSAGSATCGGGTGGFQAGGQPGTANLGGGGGGANGGGNIGGSSGAGAVIISI